MRQNTIGYKESFAERKKLMHQEDIERFAFLYLCGEHDRKILNNQESMTREDFVRLSYLTYHFGLSAFHMRIWKDY